MSQALQQPKRAQDLTGGQKSAILCMVLGADVSARIMEQLSADQVEGISREIAQTPRVSSDLVDSVLSEYQDVARAVESIAEGGVDYARQILERVLGVGKAEELLQRIQDHMGEISMSKLKKAAPDVLHNVLRGEHPQTVALILAHLDVRQAVGVVETMDPARAGDVLYRIASMEKVSPEMLQIVEAGLSSKADLSLSQEMTLSGGPEAVAQVLNLTTGSLEKSLLESIGDRDAEIAEAIKNLMFVFEDVKLLDNRSIQRLLRELDGKELALALKGASEELMSYIIGNMSERAAGALEEEIEYLGPVRVKDVETCHLRIIEMVRSLEEAGEIVISGRGGDDDVIE